MRLKKQFLHLYCNSNKKGFLTGNKIEITAMAFNDFSDRGKPDSMIIRCTLSGEECFSLLQGQTVVSVFNLQKVHIASGFACNENAAHPLLLAAARLNGIVQKIAQHITKKVSDKLHQIFKNDRETYEKYWNDISAFIKFGCLKDEKFYDRMKDILLLHTIDGEYKTLEEYPKADENKIYYVTDENLQAQYISMFRQNGLTAAVLTHVIDPHFISMLEYKEQEKLKFLRIDSDLGRAQDRADRGGETAAGGTGQTADRAL